MSNGGTEVLKKSVTAGDHQAVSVAGSPLFFMLPGQVIPTVLPADPPHYWSPSRDDVLAATVYAEDMWKSAIGKAITKMAAMGWKVSDTNDSQLRTKRAQELLIRADNGAGWVPFLSKHLRDFLCTDNGSFIEVVRASRGVGSKILGLMHLDSHRCTRTGDPNVPVLYRDKVGNVHEMKAHQVLCFADLPDPRETWHGVGLCAASRAYRTITKLASIERYVYEKVTGSRVLAVHMVNGVSNEQLSQALALTDVQQQQRGFVVYKGAAIVSILDPTATPAVATIPLAELPDGFDAKQERDNAYLIYANAIGIAVQDIQPLSGQGLGTGTQTVILDEAAEGQGLAAWRKQWEHAMNEWVLPPSTSFQMVNENDLRDQKARAEVRKVRAEERKVRIDSGEITAAESRQLALDDGDLPAAMQPNDLTAGGQLSDTDKPVDMGEVETVAVPEPEPVVAVKATRDVDTLLDSELDAARAEYQAVQE